MCQRVEAMQTKLSQTKSALKDIEIQKEESINKFREQKTKYSQLNDELKKLKSKNEDKGRQAEIEKLISEMNKDLRQKYFFFIFLFITFFNRETHQ
jgi:vacuolar-type H+-ATPase subunit I/STV1